MRQYKIWTGKEMITESGFIQINGNGSFKYFDGDNWISDEDNEDAVLLESTMLSDIENNEIFIKDIVKFNKEFTYEGVVKYSGNSYYVEFNDENEQECSIPLSDITVLEIVGNEFDEGLKKIDNNIFSLKKGDTYFSIENGIIIELIIENEENLFLYDQNLFTCNVFLTKEDAEAYLIKQRNIVKFKKYCFDNGINTNYHEGLSESTIVLIREGYLEIAYLYFDGNSLGYFTKEDANKLIKDIPELITNILQP